MSIVKGSGGFLGVAANLLPTGTYTILTWFKRDQIGDFSHIWEYRNTATNYVTLETRAGPLRVYDLQALANSPSTAGSSTANTWHPVVITRDSTNNDLGIDTDFESLVSGGQSGAYQTPSSPEFKVFGLVDESEVADPGTKIGALVFYQAELDATDIAYLIGGGDPTGLPSETAPTALWIDSAGVAVDGSDNVTSWTDQIGSLVLSPSGTVTSDEADMAPLAYAGVDPNITVTPADLPLTPGGTISGSYSNYETVPTTLTVSDGTNTTTIASPTISDNGNGTGTFSGTMPSLPTSGTANLILFGNVTVELS